MEKEKKLAYMEGPKIFLLSVYITWIKMIIANNYS